MQRANGAAAPDVAVSQLNCERRILLRYGSDVFAAFNATQLPSNTPPPPPSSSSLSQSSSPLRPTIFPLEDEKGVIKSSRPNRVAWASNVYPFNGFMPLIPTYSGIISEVLHAPGGRFPL